MVRRAPSARSTFDARCSWVAEPEDELVPEKGGGVETPPGTWDGVPPLNGCGVETAPGTCEFVTAGRAAPPRAFACPELVEGFTVAFPCEIWLLRAEFPWEGEVADCACEAPYVKTAAIKTSSIANNVAGWL